MIRAKESEFAMSFRSLIPPIFQRWCLEPSSKSPSRSSMEEEEPNSPPLHPPRASPSPSSPLRPDISIHFHNKERHLLEEVLIKNFENSRKAFGVGGEYSYSPEALRLHKPILAFSSKERISKDEARQRMLSWRRTTRIRKKSCYNIATAPAENA